MSDPKSKQEELRRGCEDPTPRQPNAVEQRAKEIGGPSGPEPTRYGDWERNGRCIDF
jgi:hypothetical protein